MQGPQALSSQGRGTGRNTRARATRAGSTRAGPARAGGRGARGTSTPSATAPSQLSQVRVVSFQFEEDFLGIDEERFLDVTLVDRVDLSGAD